MTSYLSDKQSTFSEYIMNDNVSNVEDKAVSDWCSMQCNT